MNQKYVVGCSFLVEREYCSKGGRITCLYRGNHQTTNLWEEITAEWATNNTSHHKKNVCFVDRTSPESLEPLFAKNVLL